jgi:hypothetical protein
MTGRTAPHILMVLSALLAGGAGLAAYAEGAPYLSSGLTAEEKFETLVRDAMPVGVSLDAMKLALDDCLRAVRSIHGRAQPTPRRTRMLESCGRLTAEITASAPSYSYGWFVRALVLEQQGDEKGFSAALMRAQLTGPNEQWVAELRADLAEDRFDALDPRVKELHLQDLALLVRSERGVHSIARRYVEEPQFRERITAIAETLAPADQRRFLDHVRSAAAALPRPPRAP